MKTVEDMRGLFFIVKGQYRKGVEPAFTNRETGDTNFLGGYDPEREETEEWYMCLDKETFNCVACGSDLNKVSRGVYNSIVSNKGNKHRYLKKLIHKVSPPMRCLYSSIYDTYGYYYEDLVEEIEDEAFEYLREHTSTMRRSNSIKNRLKKTTPKTNTTPQKAVSIIKKRPIKKTFKKRSL